MQVNDNDNYNNPFLSLSLFVRTQDLGSQGQDMQKEEEAEEEEGEGEEGEGEETDD